MVRSAVRCIANSLPAAALAVCVLSAAALGQDIGPDPLLAPRDVVDIQLTALQHNDRPSPNAGIRQTFALAHPDNKRVTGPLPRFTRMIRSPAFSHLIDHSAHQIETLAEAADSVRFRVVIETPSGTAFAHLWEVRRVTDGPDAGAWLTTNVSPPFPAGQAL